MKSTDTEIMLVEQIMIIGLHAYIDWILGCWDLSPDTNEQWQQLQIYFNFYRSLNFAIYNN